MAYQLGDVFIGEYSVTQNFGARPEVYSALYSLRGHNGVDFGCPSVTPILAAANGVVSETGFDKNGYGNYIKIHHTDYLTLYGHLNDLVVKQGDVMVSGQLIAHSNNTGYSDAPHLHFGVAPCDQNGVKTDPNNGYSGYIDPQGPLCEWHIENLSAPVVPSVSPAALIQVDAAQDSVKFAQANNYLSVVAFGLQHGFGVYLTNNGDSIDLKNNPGDTNGGEKLNKWIASLLANQQQNNTPTISQIQSLPDSQKQTILQSLLSGVRNFIFTQQGGN